MSGSCAHDQLGESLEFAEYPVGKRRRAVVALGPAGHQVKGPRQQLVFDPPAATHPVTARRLADGPHRSELLRSGANTHVCHALVGDPLGQLVGDVDHPQGNRQAWSAFEQVATLRRCQSAKDPIGGPLHQCQPQAITCHRALRAYHFGGVARTW